MSSRIQLHDRLAPLDESLPVAGICSSGRVWVPPTRKARISPLSKSLGRPSRKRPAWITKSPRREDSWTRTASTAFERKPAAITRISGLLIPQIPDLPIFQGKNPIHFLLHLEFLPSLFSMQINLPRITVSCFPLPVFWMARARRILYLSLKSRIP